MNNIFRLVLIILYVEVFCVPQSMAQIILSNELLDSLISNTVVRSKYNKSQTFIFPDFPSIIKLSNFNNSLYSFYTSSTTIYVRAEIPKNSRIYLHNKRVYFIILDSLPADTNLHNKLLCSESVYYNQILDSIEMPYRAIKGLIISRQKLVVYKVKRRTYCKNNFVITSEAYIPYSSAPKHFQPINDYSDHGKISLFYYGNRMRLKEEYFNDLKPIKPIKFRLSRKNK